MYLLPTIDYLKLMYQPTYYWCIGCFARYRRWTNVEEKCQVSDFSALTAQRRETVTVTPQHRLAPPAKRVEAVCGPSLPRITAEISGQNTTAKIVKASESWATSGRLGTEIKTWIAAHCRSAFHRWFSSLVSPRVDQTAEPSSSHWLPEQQRKESIKSQVHSLKSSRKWIRCYTDCLWKKREDTNRVVEEWTREYEQRHWWPWKDDNRILWASLCHEFSDADGAEQVFESHKSPNFTAEIGICDSSGTT